MATAEFKICEKRQSILKTDGHLLIEGGPGSGKTTIALLKAKEIITRKLLSPNQKILFLSFARATISRIEEQAGNLITADHKKQIEINTYHGFCWSIIKAYGYLLPPKKSLKLITPPNLAAMTAGITGEELIGFKDDLLQSQGLICFDLFAPTALQLLERAAKIRSIYSTAYPYIIVDEFQDTDNHEWSIIKSLANDSTIVALADLDQRIYDFRKGSSVTRVPEYKAILRATCFDLGKENNRSAETDIVEFGDDLLIGLNTTKEYRNVKVIKYPYYKGEYTRINLKTSVFDSLKRLKRSGAKFSMAILVKRKADTLIISSFLSQHKIEHEVLIDTAGPALSASIIAYLLEPLNESESSNRLLKLILDHLKGRKGEKPTKKDIELSKVLEQYLDTGTLRGVKRKLIIDELQTIIDKRKKIVLTGGPGSDWLTIRALFEGVQSDCLKNVFEDALYIKLLHKGAVLNESLTAMWREKGTYATARIAVDKALVQEHFSMTHRTYNGIYVMNIHKSKGKEFDEVIIWEEYKKPLVYPGDEDQGRLLLRVAVTRARSFATILTPAAEPCILL